MNYNLENLIAMPLGQGLMLAPYDAQRFFELGFIFINTPIINKSIGLNKWTLTFFMLPPMRGKGLMVASLGRILYLLKT